jgi:hypothetical protein
VQLGMRRRVLGHLEQWLEYVCSLRQVWCPMRHASQPRTLHDLFKVVNQAATFEHLVQPRNLDEPSDVVRHKFVVDNPFGELVPFVGAPTRLMSFFRHLLSDGMKPPKQMTYLP